MTFKIFGHNIAAVSLIEIMMIFTIIGIVTLACANLAKPKYEYTKKIKLYAALSELESAAKILTKEGHLDYTTDVNTCKNRDYNTNVCTDYEGKYPGQSNQLPKVSMRDSWSVADVGINTTAYANLSDVEKKQFKYLQSGLCQRLGHIFNIPDTNISCSTTTDASGLINDSNAYPTDFTQFQPQLYLANGQVIYIGKNLYTDFRANNGVTNKKVINLVPVHHNMEYYLKPSVNAIIYIEPSGLSEGLFSSPNETRLAAVELSPNPDYESQLFHLYLKDMWSKNKDYFIVYVDIDCKKTSNDDKQCGNDRLNEDVFAFRMYRDGTVMPDYNSGFPQDALKAKVLVKDKEDMFGRYRNHANYTYANLPLNQAKCYANLAGTYARFNYYDYTGMCTFNGTSIKALDDCVSIHGETACKAVLNKPSFITR